MKKTILALTLVLLATQSNIVRAEDLDYQAILELDESRLKEQSIEKGKEFIEESKKDEAPDEGRYFVSIRNEFPESIKLWFRDELGNTGLELYLNAYENIDRLSINKLTNYTVHVYNVYGQELGKLRDTINGQSLIQVSPFLLVKEYSFKKVNTEVIEELPKIIFKEAKKTQEKEKPIGLQSQEIIEEPQTKINQEINNKRSIKVANISNRTVHIDITEPGGKTIGKGWTIANDIYEAQFLNFEAEPIKLSNEAELKLKAEGLEPIITKAHELAIDERGNFTWMIEDLD